MSDSRSDYLRPPQVAAFWGLSERQARNVTSQLEALGFAVAPDEGGTRLVPPGLAAAVKACRAQKRELASLRLDPAMSRYLTRGAATDELDAFDLLIYLANETAIVRECIGVMAVALSVGAAQSSYRPFSWENSGLPNPKRSL